MHSPTIPSHCARHAQYEQGCGSCALAALDASFETPAEARARERKERQAADARRPMSNPSGRYVLAAILLLLWLVGSPFLGAALGWQDQLGLFMGLPLIVIIGGALLLAGAANVFDWVRLRLRRG